MTYFSGVFLFGRSRFATKVCLSVVVLLATLLASPFSLANTQGSREESARLEQVQKDIRELQALLEKIRKERGEVERRLEQTEKQISEVNKQRRMTEQELKEAEASKAVQQDKRNNLEQELEERKKDVALSLRAAYLVGQSPYLKLLLNQDDAARTGRMLAYYQHFNQVQADSLEQLNITSNELAVVEKELAATREKIEVRHKRLVLQEQQLEDTKQSRSRAVKQLDGQFARSSTHLVRLEKEQAQLQQVLDSVMGMALIPQSAQTDAPFDKSKGKLRWPLNGKVVHKFGQKRDNTRFTWNGIFISAKAGTDVVAPHNGRVVFSDWMQSFGQLMIIDHGKGYMTLYAHNEALLKAEGDWVLAGEPITRVGDSGGLSTPGLYFEIRHKGKPSNPAQWLTASR